MRWELEENGVDSRPNVNLNTAEYEYKRSCQIY